MFRKLTVIIVAVGRYAVHGCRKFACGARQLRVVVNSVFD